MKARLWVPLGDARARRSGRERRGTWRHVERALLNVGGPPGDRTAEIVWRGFPYAVRETGAGVWQLELFGAPDAHRVRVRVPPRPPYKRGRWLVLTLYPIRSRVGVRREVVGYVVWRGVFRAVRRCPGGFELIPPRVRKP